MTDEATTLTADVREFTGDGHIKLDPTIPASATNFAVTLAFIRAEVNSIWISAPGNLTLKTNNSGAPIDTINLLANIPKKWNLDQPIGEMMFTADVTALFVTNPAAVPVELKIRILHDITPST